MTPTPLEAAITAKAALLQVTRSSLQLIDFSAQPNGEALRKTYVSAAVTLAKELLLLQRQAVLPSELNTEAASVNTSLTAQSNAAEKSQPEASQFQTPTTPPNLSQGSQAYETPPCLKSVNKWLFQEDYFFSSDRSALDSLNHRANLPISYDETESKPDEEVPSTLLATLDPYTSDEVLSVAHGLRHADALVIESRTKSEMMDSTDFIAKITRTKSYLHPAKGLKDDPAAVALVAEFDTVLKQFQINGTAMVKRYVGMEYLHFRKKLLPLVLKGLFRLSKRMVASRRPQYQVNMILDVASLKPRAEDIPESDDQLAGYALLLLLASPSSLVIAKYAGLDDTTGQQDLFAYALMVQPACPVPNTADVARTPGSSETRSAQKATTLPRNPPVTCNPSAPQKSHSSKQPATASDDTNNKSADGDYNTNGDNSFQYAPASQEDTADEALPPTVIIGQRFFPLPSSRGWDIARETAQNLQPIANHITMGQRIALARRMTKSRCLVASKELNIKRDIFAATNSVNDIISRSAVNSSRVLAILTTWRRTFFEQLTKRLDRQLERRTTRKLPPKPSPQSKLPATTTTTLQTSDAPRGTPEVVNLAADDSASEASPLKKRKPNSLTKSSKNVQDEAASASTSSNHTKQPRGRKSLSFQKKQPPTNPPQSSNGSEEDTSQKPRRQQQQQQQRRKRKGQPPQQHHRNQRRGQTKRDS
jgi:hypothetical protein